MISASFRFHARLNDFLPKEKKDSVIPLTFQAGQSVKHLIEALGIPHTEIKRILAGERPVSMNYLVRDGDQLEVYPVSPGDAVPRAGLRFLLDNHLGRLAAYLRMLGYDSLYRNDYQDEELAEIAEREERILLTRDRRLLMRKAIRYGYWVRSQAPRRQLQEVLERYGISPGPAPFQRCLRCNSMLRPVNKAEILDRLEPLTRQYFDEFHLCPACNQIYWKGSHYERMRRIIQSIQGSRQED